MELVELIQQQLGITEEQAKGGLGLLFKQVQEQLSAGDFKQVADAIPNLQALVNNIPESDGGGLAGMLGGLAKSVGLDSLGKLATVAEGFKKLGLDPKMVLQFIPKVLEWAQKNGGPQLKAILEKVLKA
ncbi:MAG: DUF2780 domain-containing protein [Planctomycetaceae bacterium]